MYPTKQAICQRCTCHVNYASTYTTNIVQDSDQSELDACKEKTDHVCATEQQQRCPCTGVHTEAMHRTLHASYRVEEHPLTGPDPAA